MTIPTPRPGLVVRYAFLWSHERDAGAIEGSKDRPYAIIVALPRDANGHIGTIVAPITHRPSDDVDASLEIPAAVCRSLGLDDGRHWIRFDELNRFLWPGYDLRPRPNGSYDYGMLPQGLFEQLRQGILTRQRSHKGKVVTRTD